METPSRLAGVAMFGAMCQMVVPIVGEKDVGKLKLDVAAIMSTITAAKL